MLGFGKSSAWHGFQKLVGRLIIAAAGGQSFANLVLQLAQGQTGNAIEVNSPTGTAGDLFKIGATGAITTAAGITAGSTVIASGGFQAGGGLFVQTNQVSPAGLVTLSLGVTGPFSSAGTVVNMANMSFTNTSGNSVSVSVTPIYNQASGSGNNTDLLINRTQTAVMSGTQLLWDAQVASVSKGSLTNTGNLTVAGNFTATNGDIIAGFGVRAGNYLSSTSGVCNSGGANNFLSLLNNNAGGRTTAGTCIKATQVTAHALTTGTLVFTEISPVYNHASGTSVANTDLLINRTETSLGTTPGNQRLIDAQVASISKFYIDNTGAVSIGAGTPIKKVLSATATLDFPSTATLTDSDLTITVTGAALNDPVILGAPNGSTLAGGDYSAWVSAADTVKVRFSNHSSGSLDPASGTFRASILQF